MRDNFINALINLAENDKEIVLLTGDLGFGVFDKFESSFPGQYFNVGVAEQNMTGIATGLALEGKIPYVNTIATFFFHFLKRGNIIENPGTSAVCANNKIVCN